MHGPASAYTLWQAWRRVEEERARVLADLRGVDQNGPAAVLWGRRRYTSAAEIRSATAPGWARLDPEAELQHKRTVERLLSDLQEARQRAQRRRQALGLAEVEERVQRLAEEAQRLSAAVRRAPVTTSADVLVRLDLIAAMWTPDGKIAEPGAPLAEVLALMEALSRCAPEVVPTWVRKRAQHAQPSGP